ncbi:expansin module family protein [Glomus cerebriforme]|uniref:Expansin module family protein n=1 Tax=Glomus cerebriforme TaxID=658196 RepID=A0A397SMQ6_9GLOM|nr:expansin module family protein [Glomus cerebriforme]
MKAILVLLILALSTFTIIRAEEGFIRRMEFSSLKKRGDVNAKITFYDDDQLDNSACYGNNGIRSYNAKPSDRIGAMSMRGLEKCYQCLKITNPRNNRSVTVKIIDKCVGCAKNQVDLTPSAFKQIADLDLGIVNIKWTPVSCPPKGRFPTFEKKRKTK